MKVLLNDILKEYSEKNSSNKYNPVAVGKYGIRKRSDIYKKELANDYSKNKIIRKNTLVIGMGSTQIDIGILSEDEIYSVSPAYHTFKINSDIVDSKYLDLLFLAKNNEYTQKYMVASARQGKSVNLKDMLKEYVEIPDFEIQHKVVEKINEIKKFLSKEDTNIAYYEELIKSRFIEMFGDINQFAKWKNCLIGDIANVSVGVVIEPSKYYSYTGVPAFRSLNIGEMKINNKDWVYFSKEGNEKNRKSIVKENDVLIVRSGSPGKSCVVTKEYDGYNAIDIIIARPNTNLVNPIFLAMFTNMPHGMMQINQGTVGVAQQHFNIGRYKNMKFILPPIELQNEFAEFVKLTDKLKFIAQKRIDLYTELLNKKMDEYFN